MNASSFKGETIQLNQMVARGGKGIFNVFLYLIKKNLSEFSNLKNQYCLENSISETNSIKKSQSHLHRKNLYQDFIITCIDSMALNVGPSNPSSNSGNTNPSSQTFRPQYNNLIDLHFTKSNVSYQNYTSLNGNDTISNHSGIIAKIKQPMPELNQIQTLPKFQGSSQKD